MKPVLLLVDLQGDYLATPQLHPLADTLVARTAALLESCRLRRIPVIHVWTTVHRDDDRRMPHWRQTNRWMCVAGTNGHEPPALLRPLDGEIIAHKTGFNAFADPELASTLGKSNCDTVIVAGLHLHACVRSAAVECLERGYQVHIAEDAVASNDPIHAAATRRWLAERCIVFEPGAAILARMDGGAPSPLIHRSPRCTDEVLFEVPIAGASEIAAATAAAQSAWPKWRRTPLATRQNLLEELARRLDDAAPVLARQMAVEIGKPLSHGLEEVRRAAENIRDVCRRARDPMPRGKEVAGIVRWQPLGVVAIISAWNNPVAIPIGKIAPALVYGNTVVWKSAPAATRVAEVVMQLLREAGIPPEAVRLLTGDHNTAQKLAADANIDAVTFTGSLLGGHAMQVICARRLVPLQAELSGNNAAIVWNDVEQSHAAAQVAWGAFAFAGQRCTANRRVIVPESHFEHFMLELQATAGRLAWGDPLEAGTEIGPVISLAKRDEVTAIIARARTDGSAHRVVLPHEALKKSAAETGAYVAPAIICCDQPDHPLVQEESMAPILVVQRAKDFEHALALCNGVRHGLIAALFSASSKLQQKFLAEARAGILKLNAATAGVDVALPFGGWKASGIGPPEHGIGDRLFYTHLQTVYGTAEIQDDA